MQALDFSTPVVLSTGRPGEYSMLMQVASRLSQLGDAE